MKLVLLMSMAAGMIAGDHHRSYSGGRKGDLYDSPSSNKEVCIFAGGGFLGSDSNLDAECMQTWTVIDGDRSGSAFQATKSGLFLSSEIGNLSKTLGSSELFHINKQQDGKVKIKNAHRDINADFDDESILCSEPELAYYSILDIDHDENINCDFILIDQQRQRYRGSSSHRNEDRMHRRLGSSVNQWTTKQWHSSSGQNRVEPPLDRFQYLLDTDYSLHQSLIDILIKINIVPGDCGMTAIAMKKVDSSHYGLVIQICEHGLITIEFLFNFGSGTVSEIKFMWKGCRGDGCPGTSPKSPGGWTKKWTPSPTSPGKPSWKTPSPTSWKKPSWKTKAPTSWEKPSWKTPSPTSWKKPSWEKPTSWNNGWNNGWSTTSNGWDNSWDNSWKSKGNDWNNGWSS